MSHRAHPLLVVALVFLVHAPALDSGFHYDDQHSLLDNPHIRDLANLPAFFSDPTAFSAQPEYAMFRPLVLTAHALNYALAGYTPWIYQLTNLLVHCLAALMVYLLLQQWPLTPAAALAGALLFGLHPLQTEAVHFVSSRSESLAALFYLAAFYGYLRDRPAPSLLSFSIALLAKATAITLPLALGLHAVLLGGGRQALRRQWPYWVLGAGYIALYTGLSAPGTGIERAAQVRPLLAQLATQAKALIHYVHLAAMPTGLNIQQQFFVSDSPLDPVPLLALLCLTSLVAVAWRPNNYGYALLFFGIALAPTLIIPLHILVNDHRPYLALLAMALGLGLALNRLRREHVLILALLFVSLSIQRGQIWRSDLALWRDAAAKAPLMPEAHYNHGYALHRTGALADAQDAYRQAIALEPDYARAHNNLGAIQQASGQLTAAVASYRRALATEPDVAETLNNLGLCYAGLGQPQQALDCYRQALDLAPQQADIWYNLGLLYRDGGQMQEAAQALRRALQLDPDIAARHPGASSAP